jgi:hypothetical protein
MQTKIERPKKQRKESKKFKGRRKKERKLES